MTIKLWGWKAFRAFFIFINRFKWKNMIPYFRSAVCSAFNSLDIVRTYSLNYRPHTSANIQLLVLIFFNTNDLCFDTTE